MAEDDEDEEEEKKMEAQNLPLMSSILKWNTVKYSVPWLTWGTYSGVFLLHTLPF